MSSIVPKQPDFAHDQSSKREMPEARPVSLFGVGAAILRRRWLIVALGVTGLLIGLAFGLLQTRQYTATAIFIPQTTETSASGLALAASQLGIRVPGTGAGWGSPVYVELLRSPSLLERIARDTLSVAEEGGRRIAIMDLLKIEGQSPSVRVDGAIQTLARIITASDDRTLGAVRLSVTTKWPSVSLALAQQLLSGINQFNIETRNSQAAAERKFVDVQAAEAERELRAAEDRLQAYVLRNRSLNDPFVFERDRLQRDVLLKQEVYASLVQARADARIREVRDTPVITVLTAPRMPIRPEPRRSIRKAIVGASLLGFVGVMIALLLDRARVVRSAPDQQAREFFELLEEIQPRFVRVRMR